MDARGDTGGHRLEKQVGGIQEMMFDVRWGSVAPRAAVGGVRAAQLANRPTAAPLTDLLMILVCCGPRRAITANAGYTARLVTSRT